ncbi:MAG: hypothetical protein LBE82_04545 [Chitinophagaceae bacterium]|jgi:predicted Zn-dependent protease|nr:hypothetical protein [Chitinophagaceae bacterium]
MDVVENKIINMLTGKSSLHETSVDELQKICDENPYFSIIHVLLAKKMKQETHPGFEQQFKRAALFFPDSQWLYNQVMPSTVENIFQTENRNEQPVTEHSETAIVEPETENKPIAENENEYLQESFHEPEDNTEDAPNSRISELLASQAATFNEPVKKDAVLTITSEPLHTIDYFASQGISIEINEDNPLGKKVKKFTDWLKQMKRISANPDNLGTTEAEEKAVIKIAEVSNQKKEILTEAMADILIQQGKKKQAIEVFEKLSLLNPRKSAYFAAQITHLKGK